MASATITIAFHTVSVGPYIAGYGSGFTVGDQIQIPVRANDGTYLVTGYAGSIAANGIGNADFNSTFSYPAQSTLAALLAGAGLPGTMNLGDAYDQTTATILTGIVTGADQSAVTRAIAITQAVTTASTLPGIHFLPNEVIGAGLTSGDDIKVPFRASDGTYWVMDATVDTNGFYLLFALPTYPAGPQSTLAAVLTAGGMPSMSLGDAYDVTTSSVLTGIVVGADQSGNPGLTPYVDVIAATSSGSTLSLHGGGFGLPIGSTSLFFIRDADQGLYWYVTMVPPTNACIDLSNTSIVHASASGYTTLALAQAAATTAGFGSNIATINDFDLTLFGDSTATQELLQSNQAGHTDQYLEAWGGAEVAVTSAVGSVSTVALTGSASSMPPSAVCQFPVRASDGQWWAVQFNADSSGNADLAAATTLGGPVSAITSLLFPWGGSGAAAISLDQAVYAPNTSAPFETNQIVYGADQYDGAAASFTITGLAWWDGEVGWNVAGTASGFAGYSLTVIPISTPAGLIAWSDTSDQNGAHSWTMGGTGTGQSGDYLGPYATMADLVAGLAAFSPSFTVSGTPVLGDALMWHEWGYSFSPAVGTILPGVVTQDILTTLSVTAAVVSGGSLSPLSGTGSGFIGSSIGDPINLPVIASDGNYWYAAALTDTSGNVDLSTGGSSGPYATLAALLTAESLPPLMQLGDAYDGDAQIVYPTVVVGADQFAASFGVTLPSTTFAGSAFNAVVTALNAESQTVVYPGTVTITSSDGAAILPPPATLTGGVGNFLVTLNTTGTQTVTATGP